MVALSLCRRPFEAKQRRHYRRVDATPTGFQPGSSALSRELSSISSSSCNTVSQIVELCLHMCRRFLMEDSSEIIS